jgi:hypothetical protein
MSNKRSANKLKIHKVYTRVLLDNNDSPILGFLYRGYPVKEFFKLDQLEGHCLVKESQIDDIFNHCLEAKEKCIIGNTIFPISLRASEAKFAGRFLIVKFSSNQQANDFFDSIDVASGTEFKSEYGPPTTIEISNLEPVKMTEENEVPLNKFMDYIFIDMQKKIVPRVRY